MQLLKVFKPKTPSLRHKIMPINKTKRLENKNLSIIKKATGGRNFLGSITTRHIGGGHKKRIKLIDNIGQIGAYSVAKIKQVVYDANRSNFLVLCETKAKKQFLRLSIEGQNINSNIYGKYYPLKKKIQLGDIVPLKQIPVGTKISNIQLKPNAITQIAKAAGVFAIVLKHEFNNTALKLASKQIITISSNCLCTIGKNSNSLHNNTILGKAGANRWRGIRPTVRGEAMNPIDHPHGGETSGGVRLKTVYGKLAKFVKSK